MKNLIIKNDPIDQPDLKMINLTEQTNGLSICDILAEINKLNDSTLAHFLGVLNFNHINIQYYNVDILDVVSTNNAITFYSNASQYGNDAIEIKLIVKQQVQGVERVIVNGNFIYTVKTKLNNSFSLS